MKLRILLAITMALLICFGCNKELKQEQPEQPEERDVWTYKTTLPGRSSDLYGSIAFSIGDKGYVGLGWVWIESESKYYYLNDLWEYNPATNKWDKKASMPTIGRKGAVGFSIGNKGYVGLGYNGFDEYVYFNDFWEFDPVTDSWTKLADFPSKHRHDAIGFSIGSKGYVGMGGSAYTFSEEYSDFWEYNPGTNSWSKKTIFDKRDHPIAFSINGKGYVGMGSNSDGAKNDFWEYNTTTDTWNAKNNFSGGNIYYPVSFTIGNKGYMIIHDATYEGDVFWEYDPEKDIWTAKANCSIYGMCHAGFSVGNKGYFMLNNALYEYTP